LDICFSTFGFGNIMTTLKIKHVHGIRTPRHLALGLKLGSNMD